MAVSFIDGGSRSTRRKAPTCHKSPINFIKKMLNQVHIAWAGFKHTTLVVIGTDCIGSYKSNYHTITTTTALWYLCNGNKMRTNIPHCRKSSQFKSKNRRKGKNNKKNKQTNKQKTYKKPPKNKQKTKHTKPTTVIL